MAGQTHAGQPIRATETQSHQRGGDLEGPRGIGPTHPCRNRKVHLVLFFLDATRASRHQFKDAEETAIVVLASHSYRPVQGGDDSKALFSVFSL